MTRMLPLAALMLFTACIPMVGRYTHMPAVEGVVTGDDGEPWGNVRVTVSDGRRSLTARTDDEGRFALPGDRPVRLWLAMAASHTAEVRVEVQGPSEFTHTFALGRGSGGYFEDRLTLALTPQCLSAVAVEEDGSSTELYSGEGCSG